MDTIEITPDNIGRWADETRQAAAVFDNEWDVKAVEWDGVLTTDSVVVECGAYKGRWALQIAQRYNPKLFCFEPQRWACHVTRVVLPLHSNAVVFNFGLWAQNTEIPFSHHGTDGASGGMMREIWQALFEIGIHRIDLMMINIEGGEYTLIPHMFEKGIFPQRFMVQCHEGDYEGLRELIEQHYTNLWDYGRTLSAWERKP